jgi:transcriptional regulator with XRE-family HTH domain
MAARIDYRKLIDDFVLDDRRIADRTDVRVSFRIGSLDEINRQANTVVREWPVTFDGGRRIQSFLTSDGAASVECHITGLFTPDQEKMLTLLGELVRYFELTEQDRRAYRISKHISPMLKEIRESLGASQAEIAVQLETTQITVSRWESADLPPGHFAMYRWCQALGLVCPPQTALVRVVDFSPGLLRFLQEDPTRLRSLTPDEFERFVAERMDRMGYNVTLTGASNRKDGGIDLIAVPKLANVGSHVIAGQVKHHRSDQTTGRDAVDRLLAWKDSYFGVGLLVTNTSFTRDAVWTAQQERNARFLRLRDFTDLKRWLEDRFGEEEDWREIPDRIELAPGVVIEIPKPKIISPIDPDG